MSREFDYFQAFDRNIGWLTEWEQAALAYKTVAIAGMGGVGGIYVQTLARLGIGGLHIADLDTFELANFNRQVGARMSTLGKTKVAVLAKDARDINPGMRIKTFPKGVTDENIDEFLKGVDLFIDGFDFFELGIRAKVFARCHQLGIPSMTAAPVGMGTSYLVFMPDGMSFEDYFQLSGVPPERQYVNFLLGVAPKGIHMRYLMDPTRADLEHRRAPSTIMGVTLCAGVVGALVVKILFRRGPPLKAAPWSHHFDPYLGRLATQYIRGGNRHPLQVVKRHIGYRLFARIAAAPKTPPSAPLAGDIEKILDLARWAPSGDNAQPWRFEIEGSTVVVHVTTDPGNIYEFNNGQPTLIAAGALLQTMRIAASGFGYSMTTRYLGGDATSHRIETSFIFDEAITPDPLIASIPTRRTIRGRYSLKRLSAEDKAALQAAVGKAFHIKWWERPKTRLFISRLSARATDIRLRLEEAYKVHLKVIDWSGRYSRTGIPAGALGLSPLTLKLMRPLMVRWDRLDFANRYLGGTIMPRLEMDVLPGFFCAAHFGVLSEKSPASVADLLNAGAAMQRLWLTAEGRGISLHPNFAPLCFAVPRPGLEGGGRLAQRKTAVERDVAVLAEGDPTRLLILGRVGFAGRNRRPDRSARLPLSDLKI